MKKSHWLALVLSSIAILGYGGIADVKVALGQDVYSSGSGEQDVAKRSFKRCGIDHDDPGWQDAIEIPANLAGRIIIINGKSYTCERMTGGNCPDRSTAVCWGPRRILQTGVKENVQNNGTNWYDKGPVAVKPPLRGGANSNNGGANGSGGNQPPFKVTLKIKDQNPISIGYNPPYGLNQSERFIRRRETILSSRQPAKSFA